jgi:uncharacterized NAD(P)/FAD-binding protein YdhS
MPDDLEQSLHQVADHLGLDEQDHALFVGGGLSIVDALVAIRDGGTWRGHTTPAGIAGAVLEGMAA